jgi:hypothetical protein
LFTALLEQDMIGIIPTMKKPSFKPALESKPATPKTLSAATETIRLLHETIASLTEQAQQLQATQDAGANVRTLKKIRRKK